MKAKDLLKRSAPLLQIHVASESDFFDQMHALDQAAPRVIVRAVRGRKCPTRAAFFTEVAAAWQFPYYFGENADALVDCLSDLRWWPAEAYVFCVQNAASFLNQEPPDSLKWFADVM